MAHNAHDTGEDAPTGSMDITEHTKMWLSFWATAKWSALVLIVIAVLLAIFRTHNG